MNQRITLQFIFLILGLGSLYGQNTCLSGTNFIRNQGDVDAFIANNPNCEVIEGNLFIWGNGTGEDIINLDGLSQIREVQGFFQIRNNPAINDLSGLSNLSKIGGQLYIQANDLLTDLEGLNNLTSIVGGIFIGQNDVLESLSGLDGVASIAGGLTIRDNVLLTNISALEGIDPNSIEVEDANMDDLTIINNVSLSDCSIENLCTLLDLDNRNFDISNNNSGCQSVAQVIEICSIVPTCISVAKIFNSQKEIDDFPVDFPHCTHILGDITIEETLANDILNLNGLAQVEVIGGALVIEDNFGLSSLSGLSNLDSVGRFLKIKNNPMLNTLSELTDLVGVNSIVLENSSITNLEGMNNIEKLGGDLTLVRNSELTTLDGIEKLDSVGDKILMLENPKLASIAALSNVKTADDLEIDDNDLLASIEGLESLESLTGYLEITYNPILENLDALSQLKSVGSYVTIRNNYDLISINGIRNIDPNSIASQDINNEDLTLYQNSKLSMCNVLSVCELLKIENKTVDIRENEDGCFDADEVINSCLSSSEDLSDANVRVFPNPFHAQIMVSAEEQIDHVSILNVFGMTVKKIVGGDQVRQINIEVSDLNAGIYFLVVSVDASTSSMKMIKE